MIDFNAKKYIKTHIQQKSTYEISKKIGVERSEILEYLQKIWKEDKFNKLIASEKGTQDNSIFSIKTLFKEYKYLFYSLAGLILLIYFNSLDNAFVSDDIAGILHNSNIANLNYVFSDFFYLTSKVIRFIIYILFGLTPIFFRLVNILAHIGSTLCLFFIVAKVVSKKVAIYSSLIFAVHPILSESIAWIGGSDYVLYGFFFLLSFVFYLYSNSNRHLQILSLISYFLMLQTSEKTFHLFLIFIFFEFCFGKLRLNWKKIVPYFVLSVIWALHYISALFWKVSSVVVDYGAEKGFDNPLLQIPVAISSYLKLIFWPSKLTIYHSELTLSYYEYVFSALILLVFLFILSWLFIKKRKISFWLIFFVVSLLPFLTPFRISWLVAERYVYLGTIGIIIPVGIIFKHFEDKSENLKQYVLFIFCILIFLLAGRTVVRNNDWQNEDSLWIATGYTSPSSAQNHNNLGDVYGRRGDLNRSFKEFSKAIELRSNYADAYHNLANTYQQLKNIDKAVENYNLAIKYNPKLWQSYQNLALIYFEKKDYKLAIFYLEKAYKINPSDINILNNIGVVFLGSGDKVSAKKIFEQVLTFDPNNENAKEALGSL